jgi:hypothetical protein
VGYKVEILPNSIVFEPDSPSIRSKEEVCYELVSYGPLRELEWHIRPPLKSTNNVEFNVFNYKLLRWESIPIKEDFLFRITDLYPVDLEFFLFYPEALDGKLPEQYHKT